MKKNLNKTISAVAATVVLFGSAMGAAAESGYVHGRTLKVGSRGESVKMLQEALNSCFGADLTADGVFGRGTKSEVMSAQKELGLRGDGVVGRMTGMKIAECEAEEETTTGTGTPATGTGTPTTSTDDLSKFTSGKGMEVRTRNFQVRNASQAQAEEGAKGVEVARFTFDVQQSDALVERINLYTKANGTVSPTTPWRVFDKLTVMVNGKEAGSIMTNNASSWDDLGSGYYKVIAGGLATVIKKDTTADIRIIADLNSGANGQTLDVKWDLYTDASGIRMTDEAAITQYTGAAGFTNTATPVTSNLATYTIKNVGSLTAVKFSVGSNDPKSTTLEAKKNASSSDYTIQEYTIKAEDGDLKIKTLPVSLKLTKSGTSGITLAANASGYGALYNALIDTTSVTINGEKFDTVLSKLATISGSDETNIISLDVNRRVTIKMGETATVKVMVKFKSLPEVSVGVPNVESGAQVSAMTPTFATYFAVENGTGDTITSATGSATGYVHTVRTTGVIAKMGVVGTPSKTTDTAGKVISVTYSIPVEVTAIGNTFYASQTALWAAAPATTEALAFTVQKSTAPTVDVVAVAGAIGAVTPTLSSSAPLSGSALRFDDGSTRTMTLNVTLTGAGASTEAYRVALKQVKVFTDSALTTGAVSVNLIPSESFQTNYETIVR